jgi:hypothetical protein
MALKDPFSITYLSAFIMCGRAKSAGGGTGYFRRLQLRAEHSASRQKSGALEPPKLSPQLKT